MKKSNLLFTLILGGFIALSCSNQTSNQTENTTQPETKTDVEAQTFTIDTETSVVNWKGTMVGVYDHFGTVKLSEGTITVKGKEVTGGSFTIDLKTMSPTDKNYDPAKESTPEKLVGHLSSPDFFDVATYPTSTFVVTGNGTTDIAGNLTVRGKTNSETVKISDITIENGKLTATGTLTFDRKKYDVAWDSPMKEMVLSNDIEISFNIVSQ